MLTDTLFTAKLGRLISLMSSTYQREDIITTLRTRRVEDVANYLLEIAEVDAGLKNDMFARRESDLHVIASDFEILSVEAFILGDEDMGQLLDVLRELMTVLGIADDEAMREMDESGLEEAMSRLNEYEEMLKYEQPKI